MKIVFSGKSDVVMGGCGCRCLPLDGPIGSNTPSVQVR